MARRESSPTLNPVSPSISAKQRNNPTAITEDQIRQRAFAIFQARGTRPGNAMEDWLQAKRELEKEFGSVQPARA